MARFSGYTGYIGRSVLAYIRHVFNLIAFFYRICMLFFYRPTEGRRALRRVVVEQMYFTGVQALPLIIPIALIMGSMLLIQFSRISGQYDLGKVTIILLVREIGPLVTAILVILRSATAVTIETSYMKVLNEIEAIEMAGIDPMRILCIPRLIGITFAILYLFIIFDLVSIIGGYAVVMAFTYIPMGNLLGQIAKAITMSDIIVGIVKAICFGITITVVCLYYGFGAKKQMTNIPKVTTNAAIECFFYILVINVAISGIFYL